jgi:hypothetical protein
MPEGYNGVIGQAENGSFYEYIPEDPDVKGLIPELADGGQAVSVALGGAEVSNAGAAVGVLLGFNPLLAALGLAGPEAQQSYVAGQEQSPIFQALTRQGEESILQNASATGGLRGGHVQGALAQFRPAMLNQFLENQYAKLGGMTRLGQNSAAGVGSAGLDVAGNIGDLLQRGGAAQAGNAIAQGNAWGGFANNLGGLAGIALGGGFRGAF